MACSVRRPTKCSTLYRRAIHRGSVLPGAVFTSVKFCTSSSLNLKNLFRCQFPRSCRFSKASLVVRAVQENDLDPYFMKMPQLRELLKERGGDSKNKSKKELLAALGVDPDPNLPQNWNFAKLKKFCKDSGISDFSQLKTRRDMVECILELSSPSKDTSKEESEGLEVAQLKFRDEEDLINQLQQFTMEELRSMAKELSVAKYGRKMDLVQRLADRIISTKAPTFTETPPESVAFDDTPVESLPDEEWLNMRDMDEAEGRAFLAMKAAQSGLNYSRFLNVQPFVRAFQVAKENLSPSAEPLSKAASLQLLQDSLESIKPQNLTILSLKTKCQALGIEMTEADSRTTIENSISSRSTTDLFGKDSASPTVRARLRTLFKEWIDAVHDQLHLTQSLKEVTSLSEEALQEQLEAAKTWSDDTTEHRELLKGIRMMEIQFFPRSLTVLAAQLIHRMMTLPVASIGQLLGLSFDQQDRLAVYPELKELVVLALSETAVSVFHEFYDSIMQVETETVQQLNHYKIAEEEIETEPAVTLGVIFGGAFQIGEMISGVRCLMDHLQSTPFDINTSDKHENGCRVVLYYFHSIEGIYQLTPAEFLSLDVSVFENASAKWQIGKKVDGIDMLLEELRLMSALIPLTPLLDVAAAGSPESLEKLKELDPLLLCSPMISRRFLQDPFSCLAYLKRRGFICPPFFRIQQKHHLQDPERCFEGFLNWCEDNRLDASSQSFLLQPYSERGQLGSVNCGGSGALMEATREAFDAQDMEAVIVHPTPPSASTIEFSCCVLETESGAVALAPTEFEQLPAKYVRAFSIPLRRHTPPRMTGEKIQAMRQTAKRVFQEFKLSGCACIRGYITVDPEIESALKNEELTYPRPIPEMPDPLRDVPLPDELLSHMAEIQKEKDKEIDALIESYDTSKYTLEALRFFEHCDRQDAKNDKPRNRYQELKDIIEMFRNRQKGPDIRTEPSPWEILRHDEMAEEEDEELDGTPMEISTGDDFTVIITGVDAMTTFAADDILFHQAAVSGLSHGAVLRHLTNLRLPYELQLPYLAPTPQMCNPLWQEANEGLDLKPEDGRPAQVWILCGGDGIGHQASLTSGLNALAKLNRFQDVQPYLFILDSVRRTSASPEVLQSLWDRREGLMKQGVPEEGLIEECTLDYLCSPRVTPCELPWRSVWCVHPGQALCCTIDEALESADRLRILQNTAILAYDTLTASFKETLLKCQADLKEAGVEGVAGLWGGEVDELPPPPRRLTLEQLATEAAANEASIFVTVQGDIAQDGTLQNFLDGFSLHYTGHSEFSCLRNGGTGCDSTAAQLCGDKYETAQYLKSFSAAVPLPRMQISSKELITCGKEPEKAKELFSQAQQQLKSDAFCLKPRQGDSGGGLLHVTASDDLVLYGDALDGGWDTIPNTLFSEDHPTVPMPKPAAESYILEPDLSPAMPKLNNRGTWTLAKGQELIEVSFGVVGEFGRMWVFNPSLLLPDSRTDQALADLLLKGMRPALTSIPSSIVKQKIVETAKRNVEKMADSMGLKGVARVDAFMNATTGDLTVIEVDATPFLGEHSLILQQGVLENPPMYPDEIFQQILKVAYMEDPQMYEEEDAELYPGGESEELERSMSPWDDNAFWETEESGSSSMDDDIESQEALRNLWGSDDEDERAENQQLQNAS